MNLSKTLFWDIDISTLDYEKHSQQIIERVLTRGKLSEWDEIVKYYGLKKIRKEALNMRFLDMITLSFCSVIFKIPKEEFRCYKHRQSMPIHWPY